MKKLIKILFCFILIASVLCTMPAYANYNAVYEKSLTDSGDNPIYAQIYLLVNLDNDTVIFEKDADKQARTKGKVIIAPIERLPTVRKVWRKANRAQAVVINSQGSPARE